MADFDWPDTLPGGPLFEGYKEIPPDIAVRTPFDSGIDQVRPRFSTGVRQMPMQLLLTDEQLQTFDNFFYNSLHGAAAFNWTNPRTGESAEFRFVGPPGEYMPVSVDKWRVQFTLEMLP